MDVIAAIAHWDGCCFLPHLQAVTDLDLSAIEGIVYVLKPILGSEVSDSVFTEFLADAWISQRFHVNIDLLIAQTLMNAEPPASMVKDVIMLTLKTQPVGGSARINWRFSLVPGDRN